MIIERNIQIDDSIWDRINKLSEQNELPVSAIVSEALELFIDQTSYAYKNK